MKIANRTNSGILALVLVMLLGFTPMTPAQAAGPQTDSMRQKIREAMKNAGETAKSPANADPQKVAPAVPVQSRRGWTPTRVSAIDEVKYFSSLDRCSVATNYVYYQPSDFTHLASWKERERRGEVVLRNLEADWCINTASAMGIQNVRKKVGSPMFYDARTGRMLADGECGNPVFANMPAVPLPPVVQYGTVRWDKEIFGPQKEDGTRDQLNKIAIPFNTFSLVIYRDGVEVTRLIMNASGSVFEKILVGHYRYKELSAKGWTQLGHWPISGEFDIGAGGITAILTKNGQELPAPPPVVTEAPPRKAPPVVYSCRVECDLTTLTKESQQGTCRGESIPAAPMTGSAWTLGGLPATASSADATSLPYNGAQVKNRTPGKNGGKVAVGFVGDVNGQTVRCGNELAFIQEQHGHKKWYAIGGLLAVGAIVAGVKLAGGEKEKPSTTGGPKPPISVISPARTNPRPGGIRISW